MNLKKKVYQHNFMTGFRSKTFYLKKKNKPAAQAAGADPPPL